jgi:OOP family OmpA-OmpF porin
MQSFNSAMESVFTLQGLKWRIEALKTGKSYSEVVLINSIEFKVEQVFLIHKETSLLLNHVSTEDAVVQDGDMVSGMLSAIKDFVHDSFQVGEEESLNTLNVGELTVWIVDSPYGVLAVVIRGNAPESFRVKISTALEEIHKLYYHELKEFDGDTDIFQAVVPIMESCLDSKLKKEIREKKPIATYIIVGIIVILLGFFTYYRINTAIKWNNVVDKLSNSPGIIIIEEDRELFGYQIKGIKDANSVNLSEVYEKYEINQNDIEEEWKEFISMENAIIIERAKNILQPPNTVDLSFENGKLIADGKADISWIDFAKKNYSSVIGVNKLEIERVSSSESESVQKLIENLETIFIHFYKNQTDFVKDQQEKLDEIVELINELNSYNRSGKIQIEITGHTDSSGSEKRNDLLSWNRANAMMKYLAEKGLTDIDFTLKGIGFKDPLVTEKDESDMQKNRRVSFKVNIKN